MFAQDVLISFLRRYPIWFKTLSLKILDLTFPFSTFSKLRYDFKPLLACVAFAFLFVLPYWLKPLMLFCALWIKVFLFFDFYAVFSNPSTPPLLSLVCIFVFTFCKGSIKRLSFFKYHFVLPVMLDLILYFYRLSFIWFFCFYHLIMLSH